MKAVVLHRLGGPDVLRYEDVPVPAPGPGEVLLRVAATSFNPGDAAIRAGRVDYARGFPLIAGFDAAGTVVGVGPGVPEELVGLDRIAYLIRPQDGSTGQFVTAPADQLAPAPKTLPLALAATLPVAGLTAWQGIHEHLAVRPGQRILVNGAGGGVGRFAVQFAKLAGATVVGVAGPHSLAAAWHADEVVDYTRGAPSGEFDGVFNTAPHITVPRTKAYVSITAFAGVRPELMVVRPDAKQLAEISRLVDERGVTPGAVEHRPMAEMPEVHRLYEAGRLHGKVILSH
ncbi:NADP-dependent oxidoreductase [Actinoplanes sp. CA-054009]